MIAKLKDLLTITFFLLTTLGLFLHTASNLHNSKDIIYNAIVELHNLK